MAEPLATTVPTLAAQQTPVAVSNSSPAPESLAAATVAAAASAGASALVPAQSPTAAPNPTAVPASMDASIPTPIKTYTITTQGWGAHTILHNDQPFLWANRTKRTWSSDQIRLSVGSENGPVVAAMMPMPMPFRGPARILLGRDPDYTPKHLWATMPKRKVGFAVWHQERVHVWKYSIADSIHPSNHRKLYDPDGKLLAVYVVGFKQVDFFEELGGDLELLCLLGLLERRHRMENPPIDAASSAGAGAGPSGIGCGGGGGGHCGS